MKLNKATSHALRVLVACARSDQDLQKVAELASELGLTQQNTFKMVHLLSRGGFMAGERGRYGGVRLARPADAIKVGDVVRVIELEAIERAEGVTLPQSQERLFDAAFEAFLTVLNQATIADMAEAQKTAKRPARSKKAKPVKPRKTSSGLSRQN